ncbi:hypothetical protein [Actinokineospora diospyrosa]|uniref:hypothetical protein n=1 Tax=Actinokineospora diospyrosa TaxID=103728 RepID=UPI003379AA7F
MRRARALASSAVSGNYLNGSANSHLFYYRLISTNVADHHHNLHHADDHYDQ